MVNKITKEEKVPTVGVTAGLDIGNGDSKCLIKIGNHDRYAVELPSVVAYTTGSNTPKVPTEEYLDNLPNELEASVSGPGISGADEGRMFFGERAIDSGLSLSMFDIANHTPKALDPLSTILIDGILASSVVRQYYLDNGKLPKAINVAASVGVPLPINDYMQYKDVYERTLTSKNHQVIIRNFEEPIVVDIHYTSCRTMAEGAAAQYAILQLDPKVLQMCIDNARQHGIHINEAYTGEVISKAKNTISIDIGDGNVNIPVITNGRINIEASTAINHGYGDVLTGAVQDLANTTASFENRRSLSSFMLDPTNKDMPAQKATWEMAQRKIDQHKPILARDIRQAFTEVFRKVGQRTQVIFGYGGGSNPMQDVMMPILAKETKVGGDENIPVLWMNSEYSRFLNRLGLYYAALHGVQSRLQ